MYSGQATYDPLTTNVCYDMLPGDASRLYQKYSRMNGVDVLQHPQYNIDDRLNPDSLAYKPEMAGRILLPSPGGEG
jgi:hypothetical protein